MKIEIDDESFQKSVLEAQTYNNLIIRDLLVPKLVDGGNCTIQVTNHHVRIFMTDTVSLRLSAQEVFDAIRIRIADPHFTFYFYPVTNLAMQTTGTIILKTKFYSPVLREILQSPWLFDENIHLDSGKVNFIVDETGENREKHLLQKAVDITWPANGDVREKRTFSKRIKENYEFINSAGKNIFFFSSSNFQLLELILELRSQIQQEFLSEYPGQLDAHSSFYAELSELGEVKTTSRIMNQPRKEYTLAFSNYFPNREICLVIRRLLMPFCDIKLVDTGDLTSFNRVRENYDGRLEIASPSLFSDVALPLAFFLDLGAGKTEKTVESLFKGQLNNGFSVFSRTKHNVPLFQSRNIYWRRYSGSIIGVDKFGRIQPQLGENLSG